jgi:hypothetical protein
VPKTPGFARSSSVDPGSFSSSLAGVCRYACSLPLSMRKKQGGSTPTIPTSGSARSNSGSSAPRTRRSESCSTRAGCAGSATVSPSTGSSATSSASPSRARCRCAQLVPHDATPRETRADHHSHAVCVEHGDAFIGETAARDVERNVVGPHRFEVLAGVSHGISEQAPELLSALLLDQPAARLLLPWDSSLRCRGATGGVGCVRSGLLRSCSPAVRESADCALPDESTQNLN